MALSKPKMALGHDENRKKVCGPCGRKLTVKSIQPLGKHHPALIVKFLNPNYDINDPRYPIGICHACRKKLDEAGKTGEIKNKPDMLNYEDIILPKPTRNYDPASTLCNCNICLHARDKSKNKRMSTDTIDESNGRYANSDISNLPAKDVVKKKRSLTICTECKQEIGPGLQHSCSIAQSSVNIVDHVLTLPDKQQEQVITSLLKTKAQNLEAETSGYQNVSLTLSTKGAKARVTLNPKTVETTKFSNESLAELQLHLNNISNRHMKGIAKWLRVHGGRSIVEPNFANHITKKGMILSDLYNLSKLSFEDGDETVERPVVWANAEDLLSAVADERGIGGQLFVKVMADGGQGFLKICMTVLPENYNPDLDREATEDDDNETMTEPGKRATYKEGGGIGKCKLTSVKRTILIAIVPDCKETHKNMKALFDITELNNISFLFVADFKLLLLCIGCQSASASFPCPYCVIPSKQLTSIVEDESEETFEMRTFGSLENKYVQFVDQFDSNKKKAKFNESTVNPPLISESSDVKVLDKCPIEELHCMQGFVNHTFEGFVKVFRKDDDEDDTKALQQALQFPKIINCKAKDYHGKIFEGNACRKMLKEADAMLDKRVLGSVDPLKVLPYVNAFKAMDKLVTACFGMKVIKEDEAMKLLKDVITTYMGLDLTVTLKMHVIFFHLLQCLPNPALQSRGLGLVSGQAGESIHKEFKIFWDKYKINDLENEKYGPNLLKAVIEFSSKHI